MFDGYTSISESVQIEVDTLHSLAVPRDVATERKQIRTRIAAKIFDRAIVGARSARIAVRHDALYKPLS